MIATILIFLALLCFLLALACKRCGQMEERIRLNEISIEALRQQIEKK